MSKRFQAFRQTTIIIESYTYDNLNQLKTATLGNNLWEYTYDNGGNILSVKKNGMTKKTYTYGDSQWKDLLTSYNGETIYYDEIGNPTLYRDNMTFSWCEGRRLSTATHGTNCFTYNYNQDGLRVSKVGRDLATDRFTYADFYWLNGKLQGERVGSRYTVFLYDQNGNPYGFYNLSGSESGYYYYIFNVQGDIIGILDSTGTQVVEYTYNPWGEILSITGTMADTIGQQNPLRYRGYYYDNETGLYYLQSRYYDPVTGRFINADGYVSTGQGMLGYNMFAYCGNNPVNLFDPEGNFAISIGIGFCIVGSFLLGVTLSSPPVQKELYTACEAIADGLYYLGSTMVDAVENLFDDVEEKEEIPAPPTNNGITYYHVTSAENAARIISTPSSILCGSKQEAGYVYAWKTKPNKYAINNSGARSTEVIVSFKTGASFIKDTGIDELNIQKYGPVVSARPGPIVIWDAKIVG